MTQAATEKKCSVENCKRPYRAKGYCNVHYKKWRRGELEKKPRYKICGEEKCNSPLYRFGYCQKHYEAWVASRKGENKGPDAAAKVAQVAQVSPAADTPAPAVPAAEVPAASTAENAAASTPAK